MTLDDFAADCTRTARDLRDTQGLFRECAEIVGADMAAGVREGVSPSGAAFKPLAHPRPGGGGGGPLNDTFALGYSLMAGPDHIIVIRRDGFSVGSKHIGLALHQYGGWVFPKRGKFLAIPASAEAKAVGSARNFPRPLAPRVGGKGGVLIEPGVMGSVGVVHYYLTRSVYVPAREPVGASERATVAVSEKVQDHITRAFKRGR